MAGQFFQAQITADGCWIYPH